MNATAKIGTAAHAVATRAWAPAALACMGIVFGDIGTSPLYALSVAAKAASADGQVSPQAVLGVVSLIFWSLIIVISIKYAILIMRADNHGEGGILALLALISPRRAKQSRRRAIMVLIGLIGATLLYGDGTIRRPFPLPERNRGHQGLCPPNGACRRPANGGDPRLVVHDPAQRHRLDRQHIRAGHANLVRGGWRPWHCRDCQDTCRAGRLSSFAGHHLSVACWALGLCGDRWRFPRGDRRRGILRRHGPFRAVSNPRRLVRLGVAGADAQLFGQGGLLLTEPDAIDSPFYQLAPEWSRYALVVLAMAATVIASQAVISGAYSLTQQAIQLGFLRAHEHRPHRRSRDRPDLCSRS